MKKTKLFFAIIFILSFFLLSNNVFANDPLSTKQGYSSAYNLSKGKGVVIAVIDSGVWQSHPELKDSNWINSKEIPGNGIDDDKNGYIDDYFGWNFVDDDANMSPKSNHGTMVAGIIAAQRDDVGTEGIAPDSKIMSLIVCDEIGCKMQSIINAIKYAVDNGANIINLSLGKKGYLGYSSLYDSSIKYAYDNNVLVVASAGNGDVDSFGQLGQNLNFIKGSPVSNDVDGINMVVGVGSTLHSSSDKTKWSNFGDLYVDVWVAGENIVSTAAPNYSDGYGYDSGNGTSFSAPIVSGVAAMLISVKPNLKLFEIIDILKRNTPFYSSSIFETANTNNCTINTFSKNLNNGDILIINEVRGLNSNNIFKLKNATENTNIDILPSSIKIFDSNKFSIDTSKLNLKEGIYSLYSDNCRIQWNSLKIIGQNNLPQTTINQNFISPSPTKIITVFSRTLKNSSKGEDVKLLQDGLIKLGYLPSNHKSINYFGNITKISVIKFQKDNKIKPASGIFGPATQKVFIEKINK